jgi:tetratricopeptide (TPR) repeat protein
LGVAYFEKKNYCLAESHFKKALGFSSNDELAKEYLYYCYLYTGRTEDAHMLSKQFSKELASKIGTDKKPAVDFIMIEGGTKISDSSNYYKPAAYFQVGLNHTIKNRISIFHALTYFNQKNFVCSLQQIQYYLKAGVPIKNNWLISPSFHYVNINFSSDFNTTTTDTLWPPGMPHVQPPPGAPPLRTTTNTSVSTFKTNSNYFIGSLAIQKIVQKFTFSVGSTISNMSGKTQYINNASLYYSLLGNSQVVLGCIGYAHTIDNYKTTYVSASPFIYTQPAKWMSIKLSYLTNKGNNLIEDNGYFVNNSPDLTKSRWSILANFHISKSISLYATYQLENKQENIQQFNYRYNIIVAGIKIVPKK